MCLLRSSWLQEQLAEAQRTGMPFIVPSRGALPEGAAYSGPMTEDTVFVVVLSYCTAGPGQPDPRNELLCDGRTSMTPGTSRMTTQAPS